MSLSAAVIRELVYAGLEGDRLVEACERIEASAIEPRARSAAAERQARYRARRKEGVTRDVTLRNGDAPLSPLEVFPQTPFPKTPNPIPPSPPKGGSSPTDFDAFWEIYPNKVGKADARKKFAKAVQTASLDTIMAGLKRYVAKTDDRPWCNPATWLHQERWGDQPADVQPRGSPSRRPPSLADAMLALSEGLTNGQDGNRTGNESDWGDAAGFPRLIEHQR